MPNSSPSSKGNHLLYISKPHHKPILLKGEAPYRVDCRLPDRIRAHAAIYFMADALTGRQSELSPARALTLLNRIQHHRIVIDQTKSVAGLSTIS